MKPKAKPTQSQDCKRKQACWPLWVQVALAVTISACGLWQDEGVPPGLYGAWETSDPRYTDCYLEISPNLLTFHGKEGGLDINHIDKIVKQKGTPPQFDIHYKNKEKQEYTLKVRFDGSANPPQLQFVTSKTQVWTPRKAYGN